MPASLASKDEGINFLAGALIWHEVSENGKTVAELLFFEVFLDMIKMAIGELPTISAAKKKLESPKKRRSAEQLGE